jgi:uncharacterized DUF497 family protein
LTVYVRLPYSGSVVPGIEFDWDDLNVTHLRRHGVAPHEFEEAILASPLELELQTEAGEERYKALGVTSKGRVLVVVWASRRGRVRAVTAYAANRRLRAIFSKYWGES